MLLAIDTSTSAIGVAVHDRRTVLSEVIREDGRRHGELLAPAVVQAMQEAGVGRQDLSRIVCGVGPGPFTGLRVGVVTALVLAHSLGLPPPDGVCSLDALAHAMVRKHEGELLVATDARRKEVYWARYAVSPTGARRLAGPGVSRAADLTDDVRALPTVGRGPGLYPESLTVPVPGGPLDVSPGELADLAAVLTRGDHPGAPGGLLPPEPLYLRRPDAVAQPTGPAR